MRSTAIAVLATALTLGACGGADSRVQTVQPRRAVSRSAVDPAPVAIFGRALVNAAYASTGSLAADAVDFAHGERPAAIPTADGTALIYASWEWSIDSSQVDSYDGKPVGRSSLRRFQLRGGKDSLLIDGAASPAVSAAGDLAFTKSTEPDYRWNRYNLETIVVRDHLTSSDATWVATPGQYSIFGWAGNRLVYTSRLPGAAEGETDAFIATRPDEALPLPKGAGVLAASPDGNELLLSSPDGAGSGVVLSLFDLDAMRTVVTTPLVSQDGPVTAIGNGASWTGNTVSAYAEAGDIGLLVALRIDQSKGSSLFDDISLTHAFRPKVVGLASMQDAYSLNGQQIVAIATINGSTATGSATGSYAEVRCDLATDSCTSTKEPDAYHGRVRNPSRPSPATIDEVNQ